LFLAVYYESYEIDSNEMEAEVVDEDEDTGENISAIEN
jgi:hypothetical protein